MATDLSQPKEPPKPTWSLDSADLPALVDRMAGSICPLGLGPDFRREVAQETWCRLAKRGDRHAGRLPEFNSSFLFTTVTNVYREKVREAVRRHQREVSIDGEDPNEATPASRTVTLGLTDSHHLDPHRQTLGRQLRRAIADCLKRLKPDRRQAVVLRLAGFTIPEIAHRLGWTLRSSEGRAYRGLRQLQACLAHKGVTP